MHRERQTHHYNSLAGPQTILFAGEKTVRNAPFRRFCQDCGKLRRCYIWENVVRCEACSIKADTPTIKDAGFSSLSRSHEHKQITRLTRQWVDAPTKAATVADLAD